MEVSLKFVQYEGTKRVSKGFFLVSYCTRGSHKPTDYRNRRLFAYRDTNALLQVLCAFKMWNKEICKFILS